MYQIIEGKEHPIGFMSKFFKDEQLNWSVPEKECLAIIFALRKWNYLLSDIYFQLHTDHANLVFLNSGHSSKVERWKLEIQQFDVGWNHISGETNVVADALSRLCFITSEHLYLLDEFKVPPEISDIIQQCHNSLVGHHGFERTLNRVLVKLESQTNLNSFKMREYVKRFIKLCPCCQFMTQVKIPIHTHPFTVGSYEPFERINIDFIGPLPEDSQGNKYIIVIIDCFSRFVDLYATKSNNAEESARELLQTMGRFGQPSQILSDNGSHFVN